VVITTPPGVIIQPPPVVIPFPNHR
jgi:hypothetical protein